MNDFGLSLGWSNGGRACQSPSSSSSSSLQHAKYARQTAPLPPLPPPPTNDNNNNQTDRPSHLLPPPLPEGELPPSLEPWKSKLQAEWTDSNALAPSSADSIPKPGPCFGRSQTKPKLLFNIRPRPRASTFIYTFVTECRPRQPLFQRRRRWRQTKIWSK